MNEEAKRHALTAALTLEKKGLLDGALQAYESAGAVEEAARLLVQLRRFKEAGQLLVGSLGVASKAVGSLDATGKKRALQAAICFSRGDELETAVELLVALGERTRAAELLRRAGDHVGAGQVLEGKERKSTGRGTAPDISLVAAQALEAQGKWDVALEAYLKLRRTGDAGRMALKMGKPADAAPLLADAGLAWEAAGAWHQAGNTAKALEQLQRVPRDTAQYRPAAVNAIRIATELNALDFHLEHFLTQFLSQPPTNDRELEALYLAGKLYERNDFIENAKDAFRRVLAIRAEYRDTGARLSQLERETAGSAMVFEQILKEDSAFRGGGPPDLMALPDLPDLPSLPSMKAPHPRQPTPRSPQPTRPVPPQPTAAFPQTEMDATWAPASTPSPAYPPPSYPPNIPPPWPQRATQPPAPTAAFPMATSAPVRPTPPKLEPGEVLAERYRLEKKIGQGGMSTVFRVHDLELGEEVALKVFTKLVEDEQMVARFKQELTLSRQLNHPNIIRLYDIGTLQGFKYITMELLSGSDLKDRLGKPLDVKTGVGFLQQICAALQHAHDKGVVHRDIKPANIFVTNEGVVKLMDFGIAKRTATPGLTVAGMIAGTPEYMSPEQINGFDKVTGSTDLYAVGVMMYEMFTGAVPFKHPEIMPLLVMQMTEPPVLPRAKNPAIPEGLEGIILRLLEKEPQNRFGSCRELGEALRTVA